MCTLSWLRQGKNYSLFFNRDESVTRQKALPPQIFEECGTRFIMPLDPQGGGTWLAVNEYGLSVALLNFYQGRMPKGRLRSRGEIVRKLATAKNYSQLKTILDEMFLQKYAPFSLLVFESTEQDDLNGIPCLRWDGKQLHVLQEQSPFFSSAIDFETVTECRRTIFSNALSNSHNKPEALIELHRSHLPEKSRFSICMHREEANTVSLSKVDIEVEAGVARYFYSDGPPCENTLNFAAELPLVKEN